MSYPPETDLKGRVALITGAASGIGLRTARSLARMGARVYIADVNDVAGRAAADALQKDGRDVHFIPLDLGTLHGAQRGADAFLKREERLDILVENAALLSKEFELNMDGIVDTMAVQYFGHVVLTNCLLPLLKRTAAEPGSDVRLVVVGSHGHQNVKTQRFAELRQFNEQYGGDHAQGQMLRHCASKLAQTLWFQELHKKLEAENSNITCVLTHTGNVYSEGACDRAQKLQFPLNYIIRLVLWLTYDTPEVGCMTTVFAASAPEVHYKAETYKGSYLMPVEGRATPSRVVGQALDESLAKELWESTERIIEQKLGENWRGQSDSKEV